MKRILYIAVLSAALISITGCMKDYLSPKAESSLDTKIIFSNPILANDAIMAIYHNINQRAWNSRLFWTGYNNDTEVTEGMNNEYTTLNDQRAFAMYNYRTSDALFADYFAGAYSCIETANLCIEGLRLYADLKNTQLAYLLGEALFLRSWMYYEIVSLFGPIPARFEPVAEKQLYFRRSDRDVIYKQILADLEEAASLMPWANGEFKDSYTATTLRPSKAAAKALRARVALTAGGKGAHLYDGEWLPNTFSADPDLSVETTYAIALKECGELMDNENRGYTLETDFEKIFKDNLAPVHNIGGEPLWKLPFKYNSRGDWMTTWGLFHTGVNSNNIQNDPYATTYMGSRVRVIATLWYDFDKADKRRNVTVVPYYYYDGRQYLARVTGMSFGKWRPEWGKQAQFTSNQADGITPIILRYSDVLLMYAEAANELEGPTSEAQNALKRVRERGFGSDQTSYVNSVSGSKSGFLKAIQDERKWEFAGERIRKNDLIRWGLLKTNMDVAKENMVKLRDRVAPYEGVPRYVFWRFKAGSTTQIEYYGYERGEIAPGTADHLNIDNTALANWMTSGNWQYHYQNAPTVTNSLVEFTGSSYLSDRYINGMYLQNPDRAQVMPIPAKVIVDNQGTLSNDFLGYDL